MAIVLKGGMEFSVLRNTTRIEAVWVTVSLLSSCILVGVVYRPPSADIEVLNDLHDFVHKQSKHNRNIILGGDFNVPSIDWETMTSMSGCRNSELLIDLAFSNNLVQMVTSPTRVTETTSSLLDLVFVSDNLCAADNHCTVVEGISDHRMVVLDCPGLVPNRLPGTVKKVKDFNAAEDESILDFLELSFERFSDLSTCANSDINQLWLFFHETVNTCIERFVPARKKITRQRSPWVTREILQVKRQAKRLNKTRKDKAKVAVLRTKLKSLIKKSRYEYYNVKMTNFLLNDPAKFWRHLQGTRQHITKIEDCGREVVDKSAIAKTFNNYFSSVFTINDGGSPEYRGSAMGVPDVQVSQEGIFEALLNLNTKKSSGPDNIPNAFLKRYAEWCSKFLFVIFSNVLEQAIVPDQWKIAKVVPIHKAGDRLQVCNYRPVSLLCSCSKVLEHFLFKHLVTHFEANNFISEQQHGFRRGFSTATQLLHTVNEFAKVLDKGGQVDVIFLDFAKAFDRVPHQKLLIKLKSLLANERLVRWLDSYLSNRHQFVEVGGVTSPTIPVISGVPQGSVLGPLLFLIYINDLIVDDSVQCRFYADDCVLFSEVDSRCNQVKLSNCLNSITQWCTNWQMSLNNSKCVYMCVTRKKKPLDFSYTINNHPLETVDEYKYLGVIITSKLTWNSHVAWIVQKAMVKLWILKRKLRHCTPRTKLAAYSTTIRPVLEYADVVWDPTSKRNIDLIEGVQKKALRFAYNEYRRKSSITKLYNLSKLPRLETRRRINRLKLLFTIVHNSSRMSFERYMEYNSSRHTRNKHSKTIVVPFCRTECLKNSFFTRTINEWNSLSESVINAATTSSFVTMLEQLFPR